MTSNHSKAARDGVERATGRSRPDWFRVLDAWGAAGRPYREIADWLTHEHGLSAWWAQKLIVEYEEARGVREPGVRRDGTFEIGASKTVGVPVDRAYAAFTVPEARERWLAGVEVRDLGSEPGRTARLAWGKGGSRLIVRFVPKGDERTEVTVQHVRLADAATAAATKTYWRERLTALKSLLEG